jgi:hypothetical protein
MKRRLSLASALVVVIALAFSASAQADTTLGTTTQPAGSDDENGCGPDSVIAQVTSDPSTPYTVPSAGMITQWQTNVSISGSGAPVTMVVLRPAGSGFTVVGADARNIPPAAPGTIATFTLPTPINVSGGETFGLYTDNAAVVCYFKEGATPAADTLADLGALAPPAPGQALTRISGDSPSGYQLNLAATFVPPPAPAHKKKCKKHKKKRSAESAKKKCKKKKKR